MVPAGLLNLASAVDTLQDPARLRAWLDGQEARVIDRITAVAETETWGPEAGASPLAGTVAATDIATALTIPERTALALMSDSAPLVNNSRRPAHPVPRPRQNLPLPRLQRPALRCDLDHTVPWAAGGPTGHHNLCSPCRKHHRTGHKTKWKPSQPRPGTITWTSAAGKTHTTPDPPAANHPARLAPDTPPGAPQDRPPDPRTDQAPPDREAPPPF